MRTLLRIAALGLCITLSLPLHAETADDCIAQYESLKTAFLLAAPNAQMACTQDAHRISLDVEGPLPAGCEGGSWDHWHLEAKAHLGTDAACVMMLRGLDDREDCGTDEIRMSLPANEGARWRNFLRDECRNAGS